MYQIQCGLEIWTNIGLKFELNKSGVVLKIIIIKVKSIVSEEYHSIKMQINRILFTRNYLPFKFCYFIKYSDIFM